MLTNDEIKKICAERVKITVTETTGNLHDKIVKCRVVLNRMSEKYIQNALSGRIAEKCEVKSFSKVLCLIFFQTCITYIWTNLLYQRALIWFLYCNLKVKPSFARPTKSKKKKELVDRNAMPKIGEFIFAKVRGYAEWPATVTEIKAPNHVWVKFFNSTQMYVFSC